MIENNSFNNQFQINIDPVNDVAHRPTWSVVIPTYNCAVYLKECLISVLDQDPGSDEMEIIVVDDCSTEDDPEDVVKELGRGRVRFFCQSKNIGKSANYSTGISMSIGHYIHLLHGDDTVEQGFYKKMESLFRQHKGASVVFSRCNYIDAHSKVTGKTRPLASKDGILYNFIEQIAVWQLIQPPSVVFKREVYETVGTYDKRLQYIEDWEFYVRSAVTFKFAYTPELLANYRIFSENSSSQSIRGGKRVSTIPKVFGIIDRYLPLGILKKIKKNRDQAAAVYLLNFIPKLVASKDLKGFLVTSKAFLHYNSDRRLVGRWLRFIIQYKKFK